VSLADLCESNWTTLQPLIPENSTNILEWFCFSGQYATQLLTTGYGLAASSRAVEFVGAVDGNDVGWSLGFMLNQTNFLLTGSGLPVGTRQLQQGTFVFLMFLCIGGAIASGAVLVSFNFKALAKKRKYIPL
jgi:hypothetical protein